MRFELEPYNRNVPEKDLISDLKRVAAQLESDTVSWEQYERLGAYAAETLRRRFGAWNFALERARLRVGKRWRIPEGELFENLADIWMRLGRQPRREDLDRVPSRVSASTYEQRFGSWRQALAAFVTFTNAEERPRSRPNDAKTGRRRATPRQPSLRLRFTVMRRDHFRCRSCGGSPSKDSSLELHVDHVTSWSKGGETILENLQTLCSRCNLGKADLSDGEA
ncbi:MAG: HNH endonuclease [candidate division NC10 bacterium]|nr:HNH endonuclease [candidate division NC10 bacterium]